MLSLYAVYASNICPEKRVALDVDERLLIDGVGDVKEPI